ncbi:hypothetical protein LBMAG27_18740 [Bacteroidota bacterium]|nr:hypothetical protein LBMAG27_18740 [Bacteroidota bacterium]
MPVADFNIVVTDKAPVNIDEWNLLSFRCNNIWQSTFNDEIQLYFNNWPWYFQCYHQEKLIGGVKIYFYESKKLPAFIRTISTRATQGSEILVDDSKNIEFSKLYFELTAAIKKWLKKKQITSFYSYSFFGETEKLISLIEYKKIWESRIGIAKIDLTKSIDELRKAINPKHRSEIFKAVRNNVTIEFVNDIDLFFLLLDETYKNQNAHPPNKNFIRNEYEIFKSNHSAQLVFAKQNGNYLCGALLYNYGKSSLYNFGGTIKNSIGAGQFLHWEIMKYLKVNGFQNYFLGETSLELSESNLKFSKGISKFKLRFGAQQLPTQHTGYALKPVQLKFWNLLKRLFIGQ